MKNPLIPAGIEPATFRFAAQHLHNCATAVPRPDIVRHDKIEKKCLLNEIAISNDSKFNTHTHTHKIEKLSKYIDLESGVSRTWKVRTKVVSVITGVLGTIKKAFEQNVQSLLGHSSATGLQKITLMSTANFIHKAYRSQWPRVLRRGSTAVRLPGSWVRIPTGAWTFVCCECCQLEVSVTSWPLVQGSPTDYSASACVTSQAHE